MVLHICFNKMLVITVNVPSFISSLGQQLPGQKMTLQLLVDYEHMSFSAMTEDDSQMTQ